MKVLFLDIDGVLNSRQYLSRADVEDRGIYGQIDPQKVALLKQIVEQTGAVIVLTSSWRDSFDQDLQPIDGVAEDMTAVLQEYGLSIFDKTITLDDKRGAEVREWLSRNEVEAFAILDDDASVDWAELAGHWVKTSYYLGLTAKETEKVIRLL